MTHRAVLERSTAAGTDNWNRPVPPVFAAVETLPCRAWSKQRKEKRDSGKEVIVEDIRAIFPADADIQTGDRLSSITDRLGRVVFAGPLAVQPVTNRGINARHREVMLTRHN